MTHLPANIVPPYINPLIFGELWDEYSSKGQSSSMKDGMQQNEHGARSPAETE